MCCPFISEPSLFPVQAECNVISFLYPTTYMCLLQWFHSLLLVRVPCFAIVFWYHCINWAGGCPSRSSSAREQVSNSTLVCSPAGHVMKWPNSDDSTWEGVRNCSAVCHNVSCDDGEPGGDPHPFPCAACGSRACMFTICGWGFCTSCRRVQDSHVCPAAMATKSWLAVASVQDRLLRPAAVLALI